jgi:hypothetical protein
VDALASDWGVLLDEQGKIVWFELGLDADRPVVDDAAEEERLLAAFAEPGD